jgi:hypothetical protein
MWRLCKELNGTKSLNNEIPPGGAITSFNLWHIPRRLDVWKRVHRSGVVLRPGPLARCFRIGKRRVLDESKAAFNKIVARIEGAILSCGRPRPCSCTVAVTCYLRRLEHPPCMP